MGIAVRLLNCIQRHNAQNVLQYSASFKIRISTTAKETGSSKQVESGASKLGDLLLVASIAKTLRQPGGIQYLEKNCNFIPLTEDVVLQILNRYSLHASKKLDFFRWCSLRSNYKHSSETYYQMFRTLCGNPYHHCNDIFELVSSMRDDGLVLNSSTFKLILDVFIRCGKFDSALAILDYVERGSTITSFLSPDVYSSIIIALVRKNQIEIAMSIFLKLLGSTSSSLENSVAIPDAIACNELLACLKKAGMKPQFTQLFKKLRNTKLYPLDRCGYNICIHAFGSWGDLGMPLNLFKEMKEKSGSFNPDLCTYNSLLHVLCLLGKVKDALIVWEELKASSGLEPDVFTYRILIQGCSKSYMVNDAMKIFTEMQCNGIRAGTFVYNSLLNGLLKARRLRDACDLFEKMVDDGIRASCWTYNILIDGLYRNGREEAAYTMFCDLKKKGKSFVDGVTYSTVILHHCREDKLEEAFQLVEEMEARGFVVDLITVTSLLIALYRKNRWDWTERLMKHIRDKSLVSTVLSWTASLEGSIRSSQSNKKDMIPMFPTVTDIAGLLNITDSSGTKGYDSLCAEDSDEIDVWSSSPHMDQLANQFTADCPSQSFSLLRGVRVMDKGDDSFDIDMVNTYLSIFLSKGNLSLACKLFEVFNDKGVNPVSFSYNSIMSSFVKKGYFKEAWGVLHAMGETVYPADIATYNVIIQGLGKMGRADLANAVLDKLTKEGGYLDIVMYNTLINALGKAGRLEEASKLFQQMKSIGINPDVVTYNTLIEVHCRAGRHKDAYNFLKMMLDAGCAPNHVTDSTLDFLGREIEKIRYQKASIIRSTQNDSS